MSIETFHNVLSNSFEDQPADIHYLIDNGFISHMRVCSNACERIVYRAHKYMIFEGHNVKPGMNIVSNYEY